MFKIIIAMRDQKNKYYGYWMRLRNNLQAWETLGMIEDWEYFRLLQRIS